MKQHIQLPNKMGLEGLNPKDQLVYVCLRSYMNKDTMEAFPSLETVSKKINTSVPTVRSSINRLKEKEYITVRKDGRKNIYKFNKLVHYEPFSPEFLENKDISFETKSFLTAAQQYMYTDVEGYGKLSMSNKELANSINSSESSIRRYNQELERKDLMTTIKNVTKDLESGCPTNTKIYRLRDLGQAIIWKLKEHDDRITENTQQINEMQNTLKEQQKLIDMLLRERNTENAEFTM